MGDPNYNVQPPIANGTDERMWAMLCHLAAFSGSIIPFGNIVGPLIIWLIKKDEYPLVDDQGKESLNFQISLMIWLAIAGVLCFVIIGIPLLFGLAIFGVIVTIMAAVQANSGVRYRYPLTIRFLS